MINHDMIYEINDICMVKDLIIRRFRCQITNYKLEVVSKLPEFANKTLKKYNVEGVETIGVWGNEPFEIKFTNCSFEKVQIKISIDGTDVLTGNVADTQVTKEMWVVDAYKDITLKAWPETHNGGAQFVFTHAGNSVANNTHGEVSSLGIIAVAVFREGHKEPQRFVEHHYHHSYWPNYFTYPYTLGGGIYYGSQNVGGGGTYSSNTIASNSAENFSSNSIFSANMDSNDEVATASCIPGVGAGDHVDQKITYTTGLTKPYFSESLRVRYLWWDDLTTKLKDIPHSAAHASGFPGDKSSIMSLGKTPRIGTENPRRVKLPEFETTYLRF